MDEGSGYCGSSGEIENCVGCDEDRDYGNDRR